MSDGEGPWIVIPRWEDFQHRDSARSQVPPWIKDHTEQLSKDAYRGLSLAQRGLLGDLRKEYARSRRELLMNPAGISQRIGQKVSKKSLTALIDAGFIQLSASNPAGIPAGIPAGVETEREEEREALSLLQSSPNQEARPPAQTGFLIPPRREAEDALKPIGSFVRAALPRTPEPEEEDF